MLLNIGGCRMLSGKVMIYNTL